MSMPSLSHPVMTCHAHSLATMPTPHRPIRVQSLGDLWHFLSKTSWISRPIAIQQYTNMVKMGFDQFQRAVKMPISNNSRMPIPISLRPFCSTVLISCNGHFFLLVSLAANNRKRHTVLHWQIVIGYSLVKKPLKQRSNPITNPAKNIIAPIPAPASHKGTPQAAMINKAIPSNIVFMDFIQSNSFANYVFFFLVVRSLGRRDATLVHSM